LKSNKIRRARERFPKLDSLVISKIRKEEIERAVDLRDHMPLICSAPKILAKFVSGSLDFSEAYDAAVQAGGDSVHLKAVKKFRDWITRPQVEGHLIDCEGKLKGHVTFELRKIESRVRYLLKKLIQ
jgi:hypothetical protein